MFTIEVKKKGKDENFDFEALEMINQECYGGRIKISNADGRNSSEGWKKLVCGRCGMGAKEISPNITLEIIQTVIDGQEREIPLSADNPDNIIKVVQKT